MFHNCLHFLLPGNDTLTITLARTDGVTNVGASFIPSLSSNLLPPDDEYPSKKRVARDKHFPLSNLRQLMPKGNYVVLIFFP